jgi:hypothetical protein
MRDAVDFDISDDRTTSILDLGVLICYKKN